MIIFKEFTFDSAHQLPWHDGKCFNLHGHTYKLQVGFRGNPDPNGILMDFGKVKEIVNALIIEKYDHQLLNNHFVNPTAELMARQFLSSLKEVNNGFSVVRLWETPTSYVEVSDEDL